MENKHLNLPIEFFQSIPKVDLHRHLEGSLRFNTVRELSRAHKMGLPATGQLKTMVQVHEDEPYTFENFLSKFATLRMFYRSPEIISRITREAIEDAAADNVHYLELRFTPVALSRAQGFPLAQVIDWVVEGAQQAQSDFGIITRLIVSVNRHEEPSLAEEVTQLAAERIQDGIVALDLAGDEVGYSAEPFTRIFKLARKKGLHITVHAGEWHTGDNVARAIQLLEAERIGHGVRVLESAEAQKAALKNKTVFEVCITSNYQSGVVSSLIAHPLPHMLAVGLNATINTDDPSISRITLSNEYKIAVDELGFSLEGLKERLLSAAQAAFIPEDERDNLTGFLDKHFPSQPPED